MTKKECSDNEEEEEDIDIVNHQDIFISPSKVRYQSPKKLKSFDFLSPSKTVRPKSPKRSLTLESVSIETEYKDEESRKHSSTDTATPRRRQRKTTKRVKLEEDDAIDYVSDTNELIHNCLLYTSRCV